MKITPVRLVAAVLAVCASCAVPRDDWNEQLDAWEDSLEESTEPPELRPIDGHSGLVDLERSALANNPELRAAFDRWEAALQRVPQAGALPEPRLTFASFIDELQTRAGGMQARVGLVQPLPWFGKLGAAARAAERSARAVGCEVEAVHLEVVHDVRDGWYELIWLDRAIEITDSHRELLLGWEDVARGHFESGRGEHVDVIRTQVELGKLENQLQGLRDMRRPVAAKLNAVLGRAPGAMLPTPPPDVPVTAEVDALQLQADLQASSPLLAAQRYRIEAAEEALVRAKKEAWPDLALGVEYSFIGDTLAVDLPGSGDDVLAVSVGVDLPIWVSSYAAARRQAEAELRAAKRMLRAKELELASDLELALFRLRDANRRIHLFRNTLIPKGEESVASSDAGYRTGHQGFLDLLDAQRVLLEFQLQTARAETDSSQALAEIQRITGQSPTRETTP